MDLEGLAKIVIDFGYRLHVDTGPGLLESVYEVLLAEAIRERGLEASRQVPVPIRYKGVVVDNAFRIDLLVERRQAKTARTIIESESAPRERRQETG